MSVDALRKAAEAVLDDPWDGEALERLLGLVRAGGLDPDDVERTLGMTRGRLEQQREWDAVVAILDTEIGLVKGTDVEAPMLAELARIFAEELVDAGNAKATYERLLAARPGDAAATEALEREEGKADKWKDVAQRYLSEAKSSSDPGFKAALLASAADVSLRYGGFDEALTCIDLLAEARALDPRNKRAANLAELVAKKLEDWEYVANVQRTILDHGTQKDDRIAAGLRLARTSLKKLEDRERAIAAYETVLDLSPGNPLAVRYLRVAFEETQDWERLAALLEDTARASKQDDPALLVELANLHWKRRQKPQAAEPFFERARKADPANAACLEFFRDVFGAKGDTTRLVAVLQDAQRAMPEGATKTALLAEIAKLAEGQENAHKAIEQYKQILRADPGNQDARDALKRLYTQTEGWVALVELHRQDLERLPQDDAAGRAAVLREIASVYRDRVKNDVTLLGVLGQLVALDDKDIEAVRELCRLCEALGRHRDLLAHQQRLAELSPSRTEKVELFRQVARRWADQFNNAQNAVTAYEALVEVEPTDAEAQSKLKELYTKRRAWAPLYALYERQLPTAEGAAKAELLAEMAKLAAERLDRGADAIRLQKEILEIDPSAAGVLDALEKQAEREKDFATVAEVLERRVDAAPDDGARLKALEKLGALYADRLKDPSASARTWRRVLDLSPGHGRALRVLRESYVAGGDWEGLEALYESQGDWEGFVDFLSTAADRATDPQQKVDISFRAARVFEDRLKTPERAARSYERVLAASPSDLRAAQKLLPIYEKEEKWARLPALYEILLAATEDPAEKVRMLRKLAAVTGGPLADKNAALLHAQRAYETEPDDEGLALLESWSRAAGSWSPFVSAVEAQLKRKSEDPSRKKALQMKLAEVYARELGRVDDAVAVYKELTLADPEDTEALQALDALLRAGSRKEDLRWLFELRAERADEGDRADLFEEWASIEDEVFGDADKAIELFERVVALAPTRKGSLRQLSRLYAAAGKHEQAASAISRHRDIAEGDERGDLEIELATTSLENLGRPAAALEACQRALELQPHDGRALSLLAQLLDKPETRSAAAKVLAVEYAATSEPRREAEALGVLLEAEAEAAERRRLHLELATVHEEKLSAPGKAFDVVLRALNEDPADLELWDRAITLAEKAGRPTDLSEAYRMHLSAGRASGKAMDAGVEAELSRRAARLHEDQLGDAEGAMPFLRRVLELEPGQREAFAQLKGILTATERWSELEELYEKTLGVTESTSEKVELLGELALVADDVIGDAAKATAYHERIVGLDPEHLASLDALERLYGKQERFDALAALLEQRLAKANVANPAATRLALGRLYLDRLSQPARSLSHLEEVLREHQADADARQLVERILELEPLRLRAARVLEVVYEARDDVRQLVRVLEIRKDGSEDAGEKRELLRRIAELRDARLKDDPGTFAALGELVPLDPEDEESRKSLLNVGRRLGKNAEVAATLGKAAEAAGTSATRGAILMTVAQIHEDLLDDGAAAEKVYRSVMQLAPEDGELVIPAARALARAFAAAGRSAELADVLSTEVALEQDADRRRELHERIATLAEDTLAQPERAIEAWKARLADDPGDVAALAALERLYERTERWRELVGVLRSREQVETDAAVRFACIEKAGRTLDQKLGEPSDAIEAYRQLRDERGADRGVLAALEDLYERTERWGDLAEALEADLGVADEVSDKLELWARLGDLRRLRQEDPSGALDAFRAALALDPTHAKSRASLEAMLDGDARRDAAGLLRPLYEIDQDSEKLVRVLVIEADTTDDPAEKLELLHEALRTTEGPLQDPARAFGFAERGLALAAGESSAEQWIEAAERLAQAAGKHRELFELFQKVCPDVIDGDAQQGMRLRMGEIARDKLGSPQLAIEKYREALDARPDDTRAMVALEALYEGGEDPKHLHGVLKQRAELTEDAGARKALLFRIAELERGPLADPTSAIATYEATLDLELDPKAVTALEELYAAADRHADLVGLYERQLERGPSNAADLRVAMAVVLRTKLGDVARAFDELGEALSAKAAHAGAVAELEILLEQGGDAEQRARAGEMLENVYLTRGDWQAVKRALGARLEGAGDPAERRELLQRLATLHEEQLEDYGAAMDTVARLFHEDVSDESVWADLERLAKVASAERRLAAIYAKELEDAGVDGEPTARLARRTGEIFAQVGEIESALAWYRKAHAFEPESRALFEAIDALLEKDARHGERVDLYRASLDFLGDAERVAALHTIAGLERRALARPERAVEAYRQVLDVDDAEPRALDALTELYQELGRDQDLAELYERRADGASDPEHAAPYRIALADLLKAKLGDPSRAIDQLETIVQQVPWNQDAIQRLESYTQDPDHKARVIEILRPLYERADDWRLLVKLNDEKLALADSTRDKVEILRENARLLDARGGERDQAFEALRRAFDLDPEDGETRAELERLAEPLGGWARLAESYERAAGSADVSDGTKRELLDALAKTYDGKLDDPRSALDAWDRLWQLDPSDPVPLDAMNDLAVMLGDWARLVEVLRRKTESASDDENASLWRQIAQTKQEMLEDEAGAIEAYEKSLELSPDQRGAIDALVDLYEPRLGAAERGEDVGKGARELAERLVELYQRSVELSEPDEGDVRYERLRKAASCHERVLENRREAIAALEAALVAKPDDAEALAELERLFRAEEMWDALLENLRLQISLAGSPERRVALRLAVGALQAKELSSPPDALEQYRLVLDEDPKNEAAIGALRAIGEANEELRIDAATALEPVLRAAGRHADTVAVLELRLRSETEPEQRSKTLRAVARLHDESLSDASAALGAVLRAVEETPEDVTLHEDAERLAERVEGGFARYCDALDKKVEGIFDVDLGRDLYVRVGRLAETKLDDPKRAAEAYAKAVERAGDQPELLRALDRLYTRLEAHKELADVLERRVSVTTEDPAAADLHHRLATLRLEKFEDTAGGLSTLRLALERAPTHAATRETLEKLTDDRAHFDEVFEMLEGVYRAAGEHGRLGALYDKRISYAGTPAERVRLRLDLARMLEGQASDPKAALGALESALADDPSDPDVLAEIDRLAPVVGTWATASAALEKAIADRDDLPPDTLRDLWMRLGGWYRDKQDARADAERAFERALAFDSSSESILEAIEALQRAPGRERELVGTLRRIAAIDAGRAADLRKEAKSIAEHHLTDAALVESILREMREADDGDVWAVSELAKVREKAGDWKEVFALVTRQIELTMDGKEIAELRHRAADLATERLDDDRKAIELFEALFEEDPTDTRASGRLRELFTKGKRWKELLGLLGRLVDLSETVEGRIALRLESAALCLEKLDASSDAAELLRAVLDEDTTNEKATILLATILEKGGRDAELAELYEKQIEETSARGDTARELTFRVKLGEVVETRLGDAGRALDAYRAVLERDARHEGALTAVARLHEQRGEKAEAAETLDRLLAIQSGEAAIATALRLADLRTALKDPAATRAVLEKALGMDRGHAEIRKRLLAIYESTGAWQELADLLEGGAELVEDAAQKIALFKKSADVHKAKRSDAGRAADLLEKASTLAPQDRELLLALCDAYSESGRGRKSIEALQKIVESYGARRSKDLAGIHYRIAKAWAAEGSPDKALEELDTAFKIDPGNVGVLRERGVLSLELAEKTADDKAKAEHIDRAQKTFQSLMMQKLDASSPISKGEVFYYMAEVSRRQGNDKKAIQMLERALDNDKNLAPAKELLAKLKP